VSKDKYVLRERLSDGTVRLTFYSRHGAGVEGGVGARLELDRRRDPPGKSAPIDLKKPGAPDLAKKPKADDAGGRARRPGGLSAEAKAGIEGVFGTGRVFIAGSDEEADEILRAVEDDDGPEPREVFYEGGIHGLARAGFSGLFLEGQLGGFADTLVGAREHRDSGDVTLTLSIAHVGSALLTAALTGPAGGFDDQVVFDVTRDREGRQVELSLLASGGVAKGGSLPPGIARALGVGADPDADQHLAGRRWEAAARMDLTDPEIGAAWEAFLLAPASAQAIAAFGEQLARRAQLDVRTYEIDSSYDGFAGGLGAGIRIGGESFRTVDQARLLKASTRPPGGLWEQRVDCVTVA